MLEPTELPEYFQKTLGWNFNKGNGSKRIKNNWWTPVSLKNPSEQYLRIIDMRNLIPDPFAKHIYFTKTFETRGKKKRRRIEREECI
jgi:hypothetical protein